MFLKLSTEKSHVPHPHRLKPLTVDKAKGTGRYADGGGLYLVVKPGPRKSWAFIYIYIYIYISLRRQDDRTWPGRLDRRLWPVAGKMSI
jgi:hypothetical protein